MSAREEAVKAFIEAICVPCTCPPEEPGARWRMVSPDCIACGTPETYVPVGLAAAAPILLAAERAEVERLNRVIAAYEEDADVALVEMAEAVEAESQAADRAIARKDAEIERLQAALALQAESVEAASTREDHIKAAHGSRIAAAIRDAGHPDGYHRVDTTREWAGIYCADCAVTERSARIAETAPEEGP